MFAPSPVFCGADPRVSITTWSLMSGPFPDFSKWCRVAGQTALPWIPSPGDNCDALSRAAYLSAL